ncbi:MAG: rod shape-determining protein MreC [Candidatus Aminicenantes bacterium]|nr:rod shape-determining protein MreC [Candidatus Aminicenantes bacterium]
MPRFLKEHRKGLALAGLMSLQALILSFQVPMGQDASFLERTAFAVFSPVQSGVRSVFRGIGRIWSRYVHLRGVEDRNRESLDEILRLRLENSVLREGLGRLENREEAAAFLGSLEKAFILAEVVGIDAVNPHKSIVINRGASHGLQNQMPVVDSQGRLVGRIVPPLGPKEATVQLITDNLSSVGVEGVEHPVPGMLNGDPGSGTCRLAYVPASDVSLVEGETLVTNGFDGIFPEGLPAGTIISVRTDGSLFKKIAVRPVFNVRRPAVVAVLTGSKGEGG